VDLRELPVVIPPLSIQKQLVAEVTAAREHIASERAAVAKLAADTAREVEQMILGQIPAL
jgi:restriction endonuclease S subunit